MMAGTAAEELAMTRAVSVGRFVVGFLFEQSLDVPLAVQNANHPQGFRLNDVEDEKVLKALHRPEAQPGEGWILSGLAAPICGIAQIDTMNSSTASRKRAAASSAPSSR